MTDEVRRGPISVLPTGGDQPLRRFAHHAMACTWEVCIVSEQPNYARQAAQAAFEEVDRIEQELSRFVAHSDVARLNALPAGRPLRIGLEALDCFEVAAQIHKDTRGAFDVTIGALLKPSEQAQPAPQPPVGLHLLEIHRPTRSVCKRADGLTVDLGGIGKGYALDRAVGILREWSINAGLIHCGQSTVYVLSHPSSQEGWPMSIRSPFKPDNSLGTACLRERALSGSGVLLHGRHIIDPRTGQAAGGVLGAWAAAPSAAVADALSTAFMVLSPPEVATYCREHPEVSGLLLVETPGGHALRRYGDGFEAIKPFDRGN